MGLSGGLVPTFLTEQLGHEAEEEALTEGCVQPMLVRMVSTINTARREVETVKMLGCGGWFLDLGQKIVPR